jgi:Domain of Unknown Function (DUF1080)
MRFATLLIFLAITPSLDDDGAGWTELAGPSGLSAWKSPTGDWADVKDAKPDSADPTHLASEPGAGVLVNGKSGRTTNLISKESFGDVEMHIEFLIPKGSNAGVKLNGQYEIQILDSWGVKTPSGKDCGGIYPRAELLPKYRYLDEGYPPKVNACKPPGEWQVLDLTFLAPRFDASGKKTANARFRKVVLNGQTIHEDREVPCPTGHAWKNAEMARGPILLQADHGPVAFRSVKVRPIPSEAK